MQDSDIGPQKVRATGRARDIVIALDRLILAFTRRWALVFSFGMLIYAGLPFLAPVLMKAGAEAPARIIYMIYGGLCHQLGYRSWFLFGEQADYPRAVFEDKTGISPDDIWDAHAFIGDEQLGYKVALCERDVAIYGAIFLAGIIYSIPAVRRRVKPLPWLLWILIALVPIGLDGFSQLLTQYPYHALPILKLLPSRESTPFLRSLTGALFGLGNAWLAYPFLDQSMREIREELEVKLKRVDEARPALAEAPQSEQQA
jgi:uncharacterized membrane protein